MRGNELTAKEAQAEETQAGVEQDKGRAQMPFVAKVGKGVHDDGGEDVGWRNQALGCSDVEAHSFSQNDGQEVGDRIGGGRGEAEEAGEAPDFEIEGVLEVFADLEPVGKG